MVKVLNPKRYNMIMEKTEEVPLIVEQKRFLTDLLKPNPEKRDYTEQPAAYLKDEPREFKERVLYLCLRGLREGILQFMQEARIMQPSEVFGEYFPIFSHHKTIEGCIMNHLLKDPIIRKYLAWNNTQGVFEANCENVASSVASNYVCQIRRKN